MLEEDNRLVLETLTGKIESFSMLVEKYQNKMFSLAFQITYDSDYSKDIVQDSFLKAYTKLTTFNTDKKFFSWIYRITLNEALNFRNHSKFSQKLNENYEEQSEFSTQDIEQQEVSKNVQLAINNLSEKYKTLIILKHYQELTYDEISEILNIPTKKVKSRLYIAREKLRQSLEELER